MKRYANGLTRVELIEIYKNGVSSTEIAKEFGLSARGVRHILKSEGIERNTVGQPRKHKVNEDFFKTWSHEMAWVLGMFLSDGCMSSTNYTISFIQKDTAILDKIERTMEASCARPLPTKTRKTPSMLISSKEIFNDLLELGMTPSKSLTIKFPNVPKEFLPSFIRGVIDGDGWVQDRGYVMNITSGSFDLSMGVYDVFRDWGLNSDVQMYENKNGSTFYRTWVRGKQDLINLHNIIYDDSDLFVEKKKMRMAQHINTNEQIALEM